MTAWLLVLYSVCTSSGISGRTDSQFSSFAVFFLRLPNDSPDMCLCVAVLSVCSEFRDEILYVDGPIYPSHCLHFMSPLLIMLNTTVTVCLPIPFVHGTVYVHSVLMYGSLTAHPVVTYLAQCTATVNQPIISTT